MAQFTALLENFNTRLWSFHVKVPVAIALEYLANDHKRVIVSINGDDGHHMGIMPAGDDVYFLNMNADIRKKHKLEEGSQLEISLKPDTSKYGMPISEEFEAVLEADEMFSDYFDKLPPGKKRNLIYIVNKVKNSDKRIEKSLIIAEHLNHFNGKIDFKALNAALKRGR
ncbi:MAG: DUF1905 domain-containing protein [Saprospiraceae bacterium]|nr:DUF1905 domain-containing protein [Saprospiraceae bacterium]